MQHILLSCRVLIVFSEIYVLVTYWNYSNTCRRNYTLLPCWISNLDKFILCRSFLLTIIIIDSTFLGGPLFPRASSCQFLQPSFLVSSSTSSVHLDFGCPQPCSHPVFVHNTFLGNSFSSLYVFFWVFPRRQIKFCRRFGTLRQVHLQRLDEEYDSERRAWLLYIPCQG
jgi:hypothetical protein